MKKVLFLIITLALFSESAQSQNYNWITPNKTYLKLFLAEDGMYRINRTDFANAGINTNDVNPKTVKVYNKGVQIPVYFEGESDGVFDANDYIDFYGTRNYGGLTKTYTEDNVLRYTTNEYFNLYSDTNVYWIDWGGANGIRMQISNYISPAVYSSPYFYDMIHLEKDKYYWLGESSSLNPFSNFTNENFLGESWYWSLLNNFSNVNNLTVSDTFSLPLLYNAPQTASVRIFAYPSNINTNILNEHSLQIKVNGILISTITVNDFKRIDTTINFSSSLLFGAGMNTVTAVYTPAAGFETAGAMNFDLFEIQYPKLFKFRNNQSLVILSGTDSTSRKFNLSGYVSSNPIQIYDVVNGIKINGYTSNLDTLKFTGKSNARFEVINKTITKKPFRIIQKQVPNYVANTNGADYLLIYNSIFSSQASQLKSYRENADNFRVTSVDIQNVYDIFNYGLEGPAGLKNFVKYVYDNWQLPKLKYVCLMGRGSLDPKKNSSTTVYTKNLIPVIGNPSSDNYFANFNTGTFTYYNQIAIGRMPAYTSAEAQAMVNNILTYESQIPQSWWKSFTFISAGQDSLEQARFLPLNNDSIIAPFILPRPLSANPDRIFRNDFNGGFTYNFADSIKNQINRGTMTVNYMGHAGLQDWELGLSDPNILSNSNGKFPLVFSMTCYTGKVADPNVRSFGERFMILNNKGAIGYVGSSGWGFVYSGGLLNDYMYMAIARDTVRRLGDILAYATKKLRPDSLSSAIRHTINCYTLQGDPAAKLRLPKVPEYSISSNDYKLSSANPAVGESVTLTVYPKNFGLYSDSCKIRFQLNSDFTNYLTKDTVLKNFKYSDSVKYNFKINVNNTYNAIVTLDYLNSNPNEYRLDNVLTFNISTKNISYLPLKPVNNSIIESDSVELAGLNPFLDISKNSVKLLIELDTTKNFNSSLKQTFVNSSITGVSTKFKAALPRLDTNILYYWRTNSIINNDSSGWSSYQIFRYLPEIPSLKRDVISSDTLTIIYKNKQEQFSETDLNNTNYNSGGIRLKEFVGNIFVRSLGSNGAEASYFSVLDKSIHIDAGGNTGLNLLKVRKLDGAILQFKNFKMTFANSSDSILNFLNTFDSTHLLLGLNAAFVANTFLLNSNAINKFAQFGSTQVQNFRIGFFDTWSFIGYLNAPASEVSESVHRLISTWTESISSVNRTFKRVNGTASFVIGPAQSWKNFSWQNTLLSSNSIKFDVYGISPGGVQSLLISNLTSNANVNLNFINAFQYPNLNLLAKLNIDTVIGLQSPVLNSFKLNYISPAELLPSISSAWQSDTAVKIGQEIKVSFDYYNPGNVDLPGVIVSLYKTNVSLQNLYKRDTIYSPLKADSMYTFYKRFEVPYLKQVSNGKSRIVAEVIPLGQNNEYYTFNNTIDFYIGINTTAHISEIDVFADGQVIRSGDFVRQKPEMKIAFKNLIPGKDLLSDTSKAVLQLNNVYIPYYVNGSINTLLKIPNNENSDGRESTAKVLYYYPSLNDGENVLKIISKNDSENDNVDTTEYTVLVSNELFVKEFYNYPNPMKEETSFIINLSGAEVPLNSKIKIYTVSGRLIKEISYPTTIGYNQIPWDGKDNDGDAIANGTYLYKFVTEDNSKTETAVQKLVVLR